jgi:hypothetical protein
MNKKYLKAKKNNDKARVKFLSDKIGTIERGYLADYFRENRKDLRAVKRLLKYKPHYIKTLCSDVRNFYRHPNYSAEKSKEFIDDVKNTFFTPYVGYDMITRLNTKLSDL